MKGKFYIKKIGRGGIPICTQEMTKTSLSCRGG